MKNPGKIILLKSGKRAIAYIKDNTPKLVSERYGRIIYYLVDNNNNFMLDENNKKIVGATLYGNCKVIGFVD